MYVYVLCYRFLCDASAAVPACDPLIVKKVADLSMYFHTPIIDFYVLCLGLEIVT